MLIYLFYYPLYQKDLTGYKIAGTSEVTVEAVDGNDVYLTIDSNIQLFVEQAIAKMLEDYTAHWLGIMLAAAKTGAILASATYPSFDPNKKDMVKYSVATICFVIFFGVYFYLIELVMALVKTLI